MPVTRAALSCDPKCAIANSLTGTGVRLIAVSPTATTGAPFGPVTAAVSSATPSATAPVSRPARPDVFITAAIRTCHQTGLARRLFLTKLGRSNPEASVPRMGGMSRPDIRQWRPPAEAEPDLVALV